MKTAIYKETLANGFTVLVKPRYTIPKVSTQLWYNVGSKHEKSGQKGIAHLIEHMIFKGTATLSECDINLITQKLSGYCNAFTSYDYTGYLFDFPSQQWMEALPILADCMKNCTFKQEFLNSELKAVIQELKMYKDDYVHSLIENLLTVMFPDHPYHHPIIGYKQDLWSLERKTLVNFYKQHYAPNNASLVVVGDVKPEDVFDYAHKYFGNLPSSPLADQDNFYHSPDLRSYSVTTYRDIAQPVVVCAWTIVGAKDKKDYLLEILNWIIGSGKGSRLYKKLVNELGVATAVESFSYDLFDYGVFFIYVEPQPHATIDQVLEYITQEFEKLAQMGPTDQEVQRAVKKTEMDYFSVLEDNQKQAYAIGKYFLATQDEMYFEDFLDYPQDKIATHIKHIAQQYLKPSLMSIGRVLPIKETDKSFWLQLQDISDQEDAKILDKKTRTAEIEEGKCVHLIDIKEPKPFRFAKSTDFVMSNGLKVLWYNQPDLPKIDLVLDFATKYYQDPVQLQGLTKCVFKLLEEGTKQYTADQLAQTLESYGMSFFSEPGTIGLRLLAKDIDTGLELLADIIMNSVFKEASIEKVRNQMLAEIQQFWDTPIQFVNQLLKERIYQGHPYQKKALGTLESIKAITRKDIIDFYTRHIIPNGTRLAVVGDLAGIHIEAKLEQIFKDWQSVKMDEMVWPNLEAPHAETIDYPIMRDQVVLAYGGLSVERTNPDYDALLLFDYILTGGALNSMGSRLFDLRERSGLFYTIGGSLLARSGKQPGMVLIKTIVSNDRLKEAEKQIEQVVDSAIETITQQELAEAKRAIINSLVDSFETTYQTAKALLFIDYYNFGKEYFDTRAKVINSITKDEVIRVVKKYISTQTLVKVRAGRI